MIQLLKKLHFLSKNAMPKMASFWKGKYPTESWDLVAHAGHENWENFITSGSKPHHFLGKHMFILIGSCAIWISTTVNQSFTTVKKKSWMIFLYSKTTRSGMLGGCFLLNLSYPSFLQNSVCGCNPASMLWSTHKFAAHKFQFFPRRATN